MKTVIRPIVGHFLLKEKLGEGLSSRVYRGIKQDARGEIEQEVALKILKSEIDVSVLKLEFEALLKVRSSNCVRVFGWEQLPFGPAIVLEYIDGVSLEEVLRTRSMTDSIALEITSQTYRGLLDLKDAKLCHGDLTPSNILIDKKGNIRLVDFGLGAGRNHCGTPRYLSPSRWKGDAPSFDADLFALALIAKEIVDPEFVFSDFGGWRHRTESFSFCPDQFSDRLMNYSRTNSTQKRLAAREALAEITLDISRRKISSWSQTLDTQVDKPRRRAKAFGIALVLWGFLTLGLKGDTSQVRSGSLLVATDRWHFIWLNQKPLGYSPFHIKGLPPGRHLLQWRNGKGVGQRFVDILGGSTLTLQDSSLSKTEE